MFREPSLFRAPTLNCESINIPSYPINPSDIFAINSFTLFELVLERKIDCLHKTINNSNGYFCVFKDRLSAAQFMSCLNLMFLFRM